MIEEIGRLGRETFVVLRIRRHDDLDRFLAHLLRDLAHAAVEQLYRVRPGGLLRRPLRDGARPAGSAGGRPDLPPLAGPPPSGPSTVEKQVRVPVWQAGPVCSTR